jgi:hypothetical protein
MANVVPTAESLNWLAGELASRLAQVLEGMTGEKFTVDWKLASKPVEEGALWWERSTSAPTIAHYGGSRS